MTLDLQKRLLDVEAEQAQPEDVFGHAAGERIMGRFCQQILSVYSERFEQISVAWVAVAGLEPGFLTPIASIPNAQLAAIPRLERRAAIELSPQHTPEVVHVGDNGYLSKAAPSSCDALVIRLIGFEEYYGVMVFCADVEHVFTGEALQEILGSLPLLNRLMAEANFSMRLTTLAAALEFPAGNVTKEEMYEQMARHACRGMAADGAVVRVVEAHNNPNLPLMARHGIVTDEQVAASGAGERICAQVFRSVEGFTVQSLRPDGSRVSLGASISASDDAELRQCGVQAYMIMKLVSDLGVDAHPVAIGLLSVFHRIPQVFSRRDVNLFRGICERMADDLALLEQRDENEAISKLLQAQNSLGTRAEITALLGHDFGHRVYHVTADAREFIEQCTRLWRDRTLPKHIESAGYALLESCGELEDIVKQLRKLGQGADEAARTFDIDDVNGPNEETRGMFGEIKRTLKAVLARNNMDLEYKVDGNCRMHGVRSILVQVLYNLVINSVDAQKESRRTKKNIVHLRCRETGSGVHRKLEFSIWDEGPGISRTVFPDPQRVFDVGSTSKPPGQGTGTGLPVARSLLGRYFGADLELVDRTKALFQFSIQSPIQNK